LHLPAPDRPVTVLQCKFQAWLSWSQPFLHDLVRGLDDHVDNVVVCTRVENLEHFPVRRLVRVPTGVLVRPSRALLAAARLRRDVAPDLIHAHFGWSGIRSLLLKHFLGLPMVTTFGGRDMGMQADLPGMKALYDLLLAASDRVICVSEDLRGAAVARGADPARTEVVRRGVDLDRFPRVERSGRDPEAPLRILMVGRLVPKKGHRMALEAAARLATAGVAFRLRVLGEGEEGPALRSLARHHGLGGYLEWGGVCAPEAVPGELAAADLLLHCAVTPPGGDREGIPNAVVEAAATGLPVVGTRHGGIGEVVTDGETGWLVDEGDVGGLARALCDAAGRPGRRRALGEAAAARARARFDVRTQVARHVEIYTELARGRRPGGPGRRIDGTGLLELPARVREALRHPLELSVSELVDEHVAPSSWREAGWPRPLERAYGLRRIGWGRELEAETERSLLLAFGRDLTLADVDPDAHPDELLGGLR